MIALRPGRAFKDDGLLGAAGGEAATRLFAPSRALVVVVAPGEPEAMLKAIEAAWSGWRGTSADQSPAPVAALPRHARVEVPGMQAWVGLRGELPKGGGAAAVAAEVVEAGPVARVRAQRGRGYSLQAEADGAALVVTAATDPEWAAEALKHVLASFDPPSLARLRLAQLRVLGPLGPARIAPEKLAAGLALHAYSVSDVAGWDDTVRSLSEAEVGGVLAACRERAAWAVAGPEGTAFPPDAEPVSVTTLQGLWIQ